MGPKYRNYTDHDINQAVDAVKNGMSQREASRKFGIPQATISDHVRGRVAEGALPGRQPALPVKVESQKAQRVINVSSKGHGITRLQLMQQAGKLAQAMEIRTPWKTHPGKQWWAGFKARNPDVTIRRPEGLSSVRSRALNPTIVGEYFILLHSVMNELGLQNQPSTVWNMDETPLNFTHTPVRVVAGKSERSTPGKTGNSREGVTVIACGNASGTVIPPLIIVKGKTRKSVEGYNMDAGPQHATWTWQEKAWSEDMLGVEWFSNHFLKFCGPSRPQLIILDGHSSHESLGLLEAATKEGIHLLCFPPHTTHYLCPLDRTVFGPLQGEYNKVVSQYLNEKPENSINKMTWPARFTQAFESKVNAINFISGFNATGIYPWNPLKIPVSAFSPSGASETEISMSREHPLLWVMQKVASTSCTSTVAAGTLVTPHTSTSTSFVTTPDSDSISEKACVPIPVCTLTRLPTVGGTSTTLPVAAGAQQTTPNTTSKIFNSPTDSSEIFNVISPPLILDVPVVADAQQPSPMLNSGILNSPTDPSAIFDAITSSSPQTFNESMIFDFDTSLFNEQGFIDVSLHPAVDSSDTPSALLNQNLEVVSVLPATGVEVEAILKEVFPDMQNITAGARGEKAKKLTGARLLTSDGVLLAKRQALEKKTREKEEKDKRKVEREMKRKIKAEELATKPTKKTKKPIK